jgi:hypothetical protein
MNNCSATRVLPVNFLRLQTAVYWIVLGGGNVDGGWDDEDDNGHWTPWSKNNHDVIICLMQL